MSKTGQMPWREVFFSGMPEILTNGKDILRSSLIVIINREIKHKFATEQEIYIQSRIIIVRKSLRNL